MGDQETCCTPIYIYIFIFTVLNLIPTILLVAHLWNRTMHIRCSRFSKTIKTSLSWQKYWQNASEVYFVFSCKKHHSIFFAGIVWKWSGSLYTIVPRSQLGTCWECSWSSGKSRVCLGSIPSIRWWQFWGLCNFWTEKQKITNFSQIAPNTVNDPQ